jgi:hypothetical protein
MTSYKVDIGEKARAGSRFLADVRDEIQRAFFTQKRRQQGLTQQAIAKKLGVNRSLVNRQVMGLENLTVRSIGELLWAIGWEPMFKAQDPMEDFGRNAQLTPAAPEPRDTEISPTGSTVPRANFRTTIRTK